MVIAPPKLEDKQISAIEIKMRETVTVRSYIYMYNCKFLSIFLPLQVDRGDFEVEETLKSCIMDTKLQQLLNLLSSLFSLTDKGN